MGLFTKKAQKTYNKTGGDQMKFLLVCPNCGDKLTIRIEIGKVSLLGKVTYNVINDQTGGVIKAFTFNQKQIKQYGQSIFNNILGCIDCPKCSVKMDSTTKF